MRSSALVIAAVLVAPLAAALAVPQPGGTVRPLPADLSDSDLVHLLLASSAWGDVRAPALMVPHDASLVGLVVKLGERAHLEPTPADLAAYARLDPRVAAPVATLLAAVDQAWELRDRAFEKLTPDERVELARLVLAGDASPRRAELELSVSPEFLFQAALLVLDTVDGIVTPALQDAVAHGAWPPAGVSDSVGILRLGSTGNDLEAKNRIVQIDPMGDDTYWNNAGGTTLLDDLDPTTPDYSIAVSLDFEGNDMYYNTAKQFIQGAGSLGIGMLKDYAGNDTYRCGIHCQGNDAEGFGLHRDYIGNDAYASGSRAVGSGDYLSVFREDQGNDNYTVGSASGGASDADEATGLLWDRAGRDQYRLNAGTSYPAYGWSDGGGRGWLVDEGQEIDYYQTALSISHPHGCNNCSWIAGEPGDFTNTNGRGNDNAGGLASLLSEDGALFRR
jgi:hypothetical protein